MIINVRDIIKPEVMPGRGDFLKEVAREEMVEPWMDEITFLLLNDMDEIVDYFESALSTADYIAIDSETTGLNVRTAEIVGLSFSYRDKECAYIPLNHNVGLNAPYKRFMDYFRSIIPKTKWVFYNAKYDAEVFHFNDIHMKAGKDFEDAMLAVCLHDSNDAQGKGLKTASKIYLQRKMIEFKNVAGVEGVDDDDMVGEGFKNAKLEEACLYAASDALNTRDLYEMFKYVKEEQKTIYEMETELIDVVREMERNGVAIDVPYFKTLERRISSKMERIKQEVYDKCQVEYGAFNIDSGPQVGRVFFEDLGIENPFKTDKGKYKTDEKTMLKLAETSGNDVLLSYRDYKKVQKLMSNYVTPYIQNLDLKIGYVAFKQFTISTGRFGGGGGKALSHYLPGVNPQNIPAIRPKKGQKVRKIKTVSHEDMDEAHYCYEYIFDGKDGIYCTRTDCSGCPFEATCENELLEDIEIDTSPNIRRGFIARDPENYIFTIDFSGVELRMAANLSGEPKWIDSFINGDGDLHMLSAMNIFKKPADQISKAERGLGKTVNFLALYGGGPFGLSQQAKIPEDEAATVLKNYWEGIPMVDALRKQVWKDAETRHAAFTKLGRKRPMPAFKLDPERAETREEKKDIRKAQSAAKREAFSHKIQGSSADLMKMAMLRCSRRIKKNGWEGKLMILLTVHDELVFECHNSIVFDAMREMSECMQVPFPDFEVPFITDIEFSDHAKSNWGMTTECRIYDDGHVYPTKVMKQAANAKMTVPEYLHSIGQEVRPPVTPGYSDKVVSYSGGPAEESKEVVEIEPEKEFPFYQKTDVEIIKYIKENSIRVDILAEEAQKVKTFAKQVVEMKQSESHHIIDGSKQIERFFTGTLGEVALEKILGVRFVDWSVGDSKDYNTPDLKILGLDAGVKTVELGKFPLIFKEPKYPEIFMFREGISAVYVLGAASVDVLKEYQEDCLVLSPELRSRGTKSGFYGLDKLKSFSSFDELKEVLNFSVEEPEEPPAPKIEAKEPLSVLPGHKTTEFPNIKLNLDGKEDQTFDFKNTPLTRRLARQLEDIFETIPGVSDVFLDFSTDSRELVLHRPKVNLSKFRIKYSTFFSK